MDNVTHTMVGAAIGEAGLKKMTGLGMATLMIAANIPDLDALIIPFGDQLHFRRGWTHGPIGLLLLPPMLTLAMIGLDRWQTWRGKRPKNRLAVRPWQLLFLAYLGALTHPFLDWLNTYGIRLLMPFSHEWYYGDAVFIIDPWIWLALGIGIFWTRRRTKRDPPASRTPAISTLALVTVYVAVMIGGSRVASEAAEREIEARGLGPVDRIMTGPVPLNPLQRDIIYDRGDDYGTGMMSLLPRMEVEIDPTFIPTNRDHAMVRLAMEEPEIDRFLYWSRFPFFEVHEEGDSARVFVGDLRFSRRAAGGWASRSVTVGRTE